MAEADDLSAKLAQELSDGVLDTERAPTIANVPTPTDNVYSLLKAVNAMRQIIELREARAGSVMDKHLSLRDLVDAGVLSLDIGGQTLAGNIAGTVVSGYGGATVNIGGGSSFSGYIDPRPTYVTPPTITGLKVAGAFTSIILTWDIASINYLNFAYVEVWRYTADNLASATLIGTSTSSLYVDEGGTVGATYYYWVRARNSENTAGAYTATTATTHGGLLQIGNVNLGPLVVDAANLAAGAVTTAKFASSIEPVGIVTSVPGTLSTKTVFNTTDGKLYRWNGAAYVATLPAADITGTLADAQLAAIAASKVTGTLSDSQLAAIAAAKITGQIVTTQITDNAITTAKINAGAVTASQIAANTITAGQIAAGTVTATEIAAGTITGAKIAAGTIAASNIAADTITASQIAANAITSSELAANSVVAGKISAGAVSATEIAASAVQATHLAANSIAVGTAAVQNGAIVNAMIANATIDSAKIAYLDAAKITAGTLDAARISAGSLHGNKLTAGTVSATEIAAGTITADRMVSGVMSADNVLTRGLTVRDGSGNIILASGTPLTQTYADGTLRNADVGAENLCKVSSMVEGPGLYGGSTGTSIKAGSSNPYALQPGEWLTISAEVWQDATSQAAGQNATLFLYTADSGGNWKQSAQLTATATSPSRLSASVHLPASSDMYTVAVSLFHQGNPPNTSGTVYADRIQVERGTVATQYRPANVNAGNPITGTNATTYISSAAIGSAQIANAAITNAKIGNLEVDSAKIANLTIGTGKVASGAITQMVTGTTSVVSPSDTSGTSKYTESYMGSIDTSASGDGKVILMLCGKPPNSQGTYTGYGWMDGASGNNNIYCRVVRSINAGAGVVISSQNFYFSGIAIRDLIDSTTLVIDSPGAGVNVAYYYTVYSTSDNTATHRAYIPPITFGIMEVRK